MQSFFFPAVFGIPLPAGPREMSTGTLTARLPPGSRGILWKARRGAKNRKWLVGGTKDSETPWAPGEGTEAGLPCQPEMPIRGSTPGFTGYAISGAVGGAGGGGVRDDAHSPA